MTGPVRRLAVVGQPISHSRSPAMHNAAIAALGLDAEWSYEAIEVAPEAFEGSIRELAEQGYAGLNVTIPHKQAALAIADLASDAAREIGAANTLSFADGQILAENTDAPGLIEALGIDVKGQRALVLGAGGAGRAACWALSRAGADVAVWNRTADRAVALSREFGVECSDDLNDISDVDLIVNATAVGLPGQSGRNLAPTRSVPDSSSVLFRVDQLGESHLVMDLVYGPETTELIRKATEQGATVVDGIEMLVRQGAASFRLWTGISPPLDVMRRAATGNRD